MSTTAPEGTGLAAQVLAIAAAHQAQVAAVKSLQLAQVLATWRELDPERVIRQWVAGAGDRAYVLVSAGQEAAADLAPDYLVDAMDAQRKIAVPPRMDARAFAGVASDGRSLETLLQVAPVRAAALQRQGRTPAQAMQAGENFLRMAVDTQINDAGRAADSVAIAAATVVNKTDQEVAEDAQADARPDVERAAPLLAPEPPARQARPLSPGAQRAQILERLKQARADLLASQPAPAAPRPSDGDLLSADRRAQVERIKAETLARIQREREERRAARARPERNIASRQEVSVGYVRYLQPPSCPRCVILAGKFYRFSDGFERHPMCDCKHIPATQDVADALTADPEAYFVSLGRAGQDAWFGKANADAIRGGADIYRVVNAQDGMFTADDGRRYTRAGPRTRRGRRGGGPVLRPTVWQIYRDAGGDRERARRALQYNGYIVQ